MRIILVGGGKVGTALARQLSEEDHSVTVIDTNKARVEHLSESYDVMGIVGNGSSITTLSEAGIEEADVFIAVTGSDELNLLCCMFAKKAGHCHAIARVRNPSYSHELDFIKKQIGISAIINPEMAAAREISHLLRFPGASKIDTFAGGRVRLIKFTLTDQQDVPDALARLRVIYPNLMRLDYDNLRTQTQNDLDAPARTEQKTPLEHFAAFYELQNNQPMTSQQTAFCQQLIETLWKEEDV